MHLFEAFLAWMEVAPGDYVWKDLAYDIARLALVRLIDPVSGALREFWDGDWMPMPEPSGRIVEPGHQFEWAFLLLRWHELADAPAAVRAANRLVEIGETYEIAPVLDLAFAELWDDMKAKDNLIKLWPQTERLRVYLRLASRADCDRELARV